MVHRPEWYQKQAYPQTPLPYCYKTICKLLNVYTRLVSKKGDTSPTSIQNLLSQGINMHQYNKLAYSWYLFLTLSWELLWRFLNGL